MCLALIVFFPRVTLLYERPAINTYENGSRMEASNCKAKELCVYLCGEAQQSLGHSLQGGQAVPFGRVAVHHDSTSSSSTL